MGDDSYNKQLADIQQSQAELQVKCERVLNLWAGKSGSKWEDVIAALQDPEVMLGHNYFCPQM